MSHRSTIQLVRTGFAGVLGLALAWGGAAVAWAATAEVAADLSEWFRPLETVTPGASLGLVTSAELVRGPDLFPDTSSQAQLIASPDGHTVWRVTGEKARLIRPDTGVTVDFGTSGYADCASGNASAVTNDGRVWIVCGVLRLAAATREGTIQVYGDPSPYMRPDKLYADNQGLVGLLRKSDELTHELVRYDTSSGGRVETERVAVDVRGLFSSSSISSSNYSRVLVTDGTILVRMAYSQNSTWSYGWARYQDGAWSRYSPDFPLDVEAPQYAARDGQGRLWLVADSGVVRIMDGAGLVTGNTLTGVSNFQAAAARGDRLWVQAGNKLSVYEMGQERQAGRGDLVLGGAASLAPDPDTASGVLVAATPCGSALCVGTMDAVTRYPAAGGPVVSPAYQGPAVTRVLTGLSPAVSQPAGTEVRWAVSVNRGGTWQVYRQGAWQPLAGLDALATEGMTTTDLGAVTQDTLGQLADRSITLAALLVASPDRQQTPVISGLTLAFKDYDAPTASQVACPPETGIAQPAPCVVTASAPVGTLQYVWTVTAGQATVTSSGATAAVKPTGREPVTVAVAVRLQEDPSKVTAPLTATIQVLLPTITATVACPVEQVGRRQAVTCEALVVASGGTPKVTWNTDGGIGQAAAGGRQVSVSWTTLGPKTLQAAVSIEEAPDWTAATASATLEVIGWPKPVLRLSGPSKIVRGATALFKGVASVPRGVLRGTVEIRWEVNGQTSAGPVLALQGERIGKLAIAAKAVVVEASGDPEAESDLLRKELTVSPVPPPSLVVRAPRFAVEGFPFTLTAVVKARHASTGPIRLEWTMPDGSVLTGQDRVTYTPAGSGGVHAVVVRAVPEGSTAVDEVAVRSVTYPVLGYAFPAFTLDKRGDRDPAAPFTVAYRVNGDRRSAPGGIFTYTWNFGDGETVVNDKSGMTHVYKTPGMYVASVTVADQAGHSQTFTDQVMVEETRPYAITVKMTPSNRWWKAPLTIKVRPTVRDGIKRDKVVKYEWRLNGAALGDRNIGVATLPEPGEYTLTLRIESQQEQKAEHQVHLVAVANQPPTCTVSQRGTMRPRQFRLAAGCKDPDGRVRGYHWDLGNGHVVENRAAVVAEYEEPGSYQVTMTATDDNGDSTTVTEMVVVN